MTKLWDKWLAETPTGCCTECHGRLSFEDSHQSRKTHKRKWACIHHLRNEVISLKKANLIRVLNAVRNKEGKE